MAKINFHAGTHAQFTAAKTANTLVATDLYFLTDAPMQLYRGATLATESFKTYANAAAKPALADMIQGVVYINLENGQMSITDGAAEQIIATARVSAIATDTDGTLVPTVAAIKSYVQSVSAGGFTSAAYKNDATDVNSLIFTSAGGATSKVALPVGIKNVEYAEATGIFTFTKDDGTVVTANTPIERMIKGVSYNDATHDLTLTFYVTVEGVETEQTVTANLDTLVDVYNAKAADASAVTVTKSTVDGAITFTVGLGLADKSLSQTAAGLKVALSATADNTLTLGADGLYVAPTDLSAYIKTVDANSAIATAKAAVFSDLASTTVGKGATLIGVSGSYGNGNSTVEAVLAAHQTAITTAQASLASLDTRMTTAEGKITAAETRIDSLDNATTGRVTLLENQLTWQTI